jgi:tRNA-specific 2-thiouridylase
MSGGVDSSVAAGLLIEQGHDVIGVHMKLHNNDARVGRAGGQSLTAESGRCCGLDDALDARQVAEKLQIPFYVLDLQEVFQKSVMDEFAGSYLAGRTPNPCVQCNGVLKFRVLLSRALALGADALATGHYARVEEGRLKMAADPDKDQTYFLFPVTRNALQKTVFPLGGLRKAEVRAHAARLGLLTADKPESQEVCFLPNDDHARFVRESAPEVDGSGEIVTEDGRVVGQHDGYFRFTVGQRRGLNVALGTPAYVLRVEPKTRRVVVTTEPRRLGATGLVAGRANWYSDPGGAVTVRVRHRGQLTGAQVQPGAEGSFEVHFEQPVRAVAPGQAAVIYRGDEVVGGGFIERALYADTVGVS